MKVKVTKLLNKTFNVEKAILKKKIAVLEKATKLIDKEHGILADAMDNEHSSNWNSKKYTGFETKYAKLEDKLYCLNNTLADLEAELDELDDTLAAITTILTAKNNNQNINLTITL